MPGIIYLGMGFPSPKTSKTSPPGSAGKKISEPTVGIHCQIRPIWWQDCPSLPGKCSTPTLLLICSSFSRENGHLFLICSSLSTALLLGLDLLLGHVADGKSSKQYSPKWWVYHGDESHGLIRKKSPTKTNPSRAMLW